MYLPIRRALLASLVFATLSGAAQSPVPQADRIAAHPNLRATTRLAGHVPTWATAANDAGPAPADTTLHLTFVLARSPEREVAFRKLLADQQTPGSSSYHHWLTPQQIGVAYGPTRNDLSALTGWLTAQGFTVTELAPSRTFITAEAPASTVANALATSFRSFHLPAAEQSPPDARPRIAATANPAIPTAFAAIVTSIIGLADAPITPAFHTPPLPDANSSGGSHLLVPADFATIYDINPVYNSGIDGTGQKIAILGRSRVLADDITNLEINTGIVSKQPNTIVPPAGVDPRMSRNADQGEATIDVDRVIATAPGAQADLVVSGTVGATNGLYITAMYAVQTLNDPILNISFSSCEANDGPSLAGPGGFWNKLFTQAAAQGISVFVSSGDSGVAQCDASGVPSPHPQTRAINDICASAYVTCVGGTQFADTASPATYWKSSNDPKTLASAISYIPEGAWNEPIGSGSTPFVVFATGGGASTLIPKPSWQAAPGVPADGFRDVPDVSFSSSFHNGYVTCAAYLNANCTTQNAIGIGGTSVAAPAMAAIAAMLNQKTGVSQGNINPLLYKLASTSTSVFHDATPATSGVACDINTPSTCNNSTPSPTALTGGLAGYALATGYDQATGLGSLDVSSFLSAVVNAESLSATPASSSLTFAVGATTGNTDLITIGSLGYGGSVSLGCTVAFNGSGTASSLPICSLSPTTVNVPANGSVTSTLTLATSLPNAPLAANHPAIRPAPPASSTSRIALCSLLLLVLLPSRRVRRSLRSGRTLFVALLLLGSLGALTACSSGSSTPVSPNPLLISSTNTTLAISAPSIFVGGTETFSATVANTGFNTVVVPTGTVSFMLTGSNTPFATATLSGAAATTAAIPYTNPGTYSLQAVYSGDGNFSASTTQIGSFTVMPPGTTPGSYTVTINATGATGLTASTTVAVTIQ